MSNPPEKLSDTLKGAYARGYSHELREYAVQAAALEGEVEQLKSELVTKAVENEYLRETIRVKS